MLNPINKHMDYSPCIEEDSQIGDSYELLVKDEVLNPMTNTVTSRIVSRTFEPKDNFSKYSVSDFYMENLIAAGAVDNLKSCQYGDGDVDLITDQIDSALNSEI